MTRSISAIAADIRQAWPKISPYAKPYLDAMYRLNRVTDDYYCDDGRTILLYFLSNASGFRGPDAKALKSELKALLVSNLSR